MPEDEIKEILACMQELTSEDGLYYYMTYGKRAFMFEIVTEGFLDTYLASLGEQIQNFEYT